MYRLAQAVRPHCVVGSLSFGGSMTSALGLLGLGEVFVGVNGNPDHGINGSRIILLSNPLELFHEKH